MFFGRYSVPPGIFRDIFGSSEPGDHCANFVLLRLPIVRPPAAAIRDLLGFGGVWALREIPSPNRQKKLDPKKIEKKLKFLFFVAVSANKFSSKTERFFFVSGPWRPL